MKCVAADFRFKYVILSLSLTFSFIHGTPSRYGLFQGAAYSGSGHKHGNKNYCAYVVHKNVTCAVLGDMETFVEREIAPCPAYQPHCPPQVRYRMQYRSMYKIGYKMVTELEWRCCPGYRGPDCKELKDGAPRQVLWEPQPTPHTPGPVDHKPRPELQGTANPSQQQYNGERGDTVSYLEDEVQRLSQTVLDMQAAMTGMSENLRVNFQEDASKMLMALRSELRMPNAALAGTTETIQLPDPRAGVEAGEIEEVKAKLTDVTDALRSKSNALDELRGTVEAHDSQIRLLMEVNRGSMDHAAIPTPAPSTPSEDTLQTYVDQKIKDLKEELMEGIEIKMADLKGSCEYKMMSVQEHCEEREANYVSLTELMESTEADLRQEIENLRLELSELRTNGQAAATEWPTGMKDLQKKMEHIAEAHHALNARLHGEIELLSVPQIENALSARLEDLESRINISERNSEMHYFSIEKKLTQIIQERTAELRDLTIKDLRSMGDQLMTMKMGMNDSFIVGNCSERFENLENEVSSSKQLIQHLENNLNVMSNSCPIECKSDVYDKIIQDLSIFRLKMMQSEVNSNSEKMRDLEHLVQELLGSPNSRNISTLLNMVDSAKTDIGTLRDLVSGLGDSLNDYSNDLQQINSTCRKMGVEEAQELVDRRLSQAAINESQLEELGYRLKLLASQVGVELNQCKDTAEGIRKEVIGVDSRVSGMEAVCGKLDGVSNSLQRIKDGLNKHVTALWTCIHQFNSTLRFHSRDINGLKGSLQNFQEQLSGIAKEMQDLGTRALIGSVEVGAETSSPAPDIKTSRSHDPATPLGRLPPLTPPPDSSLLPAVPQQPVLETGEAGPPGTMHRATSKLPQSIGSMTPIMGFAGAPGYPPLVSVAKPNVSPAVHLPPQTATPGAAATPGTSVGEGPFSFSAGFALVTPLNGTGVIRFNKVLVNDGGYYDPLTGIFTVPVDGRYLLTAVLTAVQGERVEAVVTVSSRSVQRLNTNGYGPDGGQGCLCGGSAPFSLILTLKRGDRVGLILTSGKLAPSDSSVVLSTFSAIFLYPPPVSR
ncbi:EMILIN-2-like [Brienomyrus brachyistius]|uniref:EMILIN-2-like n=1 Tax=Brienomyrus brachyistius TaxID=42636 RepID=UPI0020B40960|nr:EMILIN-2-like [Brienomyrus brachyistius]